MTKENKKDIIYGILSDSTVIATKTEAAILIKLVKLKNETARKKFTMTQLSEELQVPQTSMISFLYKFCNRHFEMDGNMISETIFHLEQKPMQKKRFHYPTWVIFK